MIKAFFLVLAIFAAVTGILICAIAGGSRLIGTYYVFGFQAMTLFVGGTAIMVFAILVKLHFGMMHELDKP